MRAAEATFRDSFKESKEQFKKRLRKTAMGLPTALAERIVGDMHRRTGLIKDAKGGLIDE